MMMEQHENVFGTKKPLIGCLHMAALPGSYYADPTMTYQIGRASCRERV